MPHKKNERYLISGQSTALKGKSAGVDKIPAKLVQAGVQDVITALTAICNKIWETGECPILWAQSLVITFPKKGNLQRCRSYGNDQPHQPPKQSHAEDHIEQIKAASGEYKLLKSRQASEQEWASKSRSFILKSSVRNTPTASKTSNMLS